jgi:FMN reductase
MQISVVVGNPSAGGRTTTAAMAVAERAAGVLGGASVELVELAEHTEGIFSWEAPVIDEINRRVAGSDLAVVASPTYKASFTGLLKAFLDRYGSNGLAGVVVIPLMLGAAPVHALAVETQLRPVLVELAATVPTKGLFVVDSQMDRLAETIDAWWELAEGPLMRALGR